MRLILIILILNLNCFSSKAYIDTTNKSFKKPKPLKSHAYHYKESKLDKYIDTAADKLGGSVLGTVLTGPVGLIIKVSDKVIKHQEKKIVHSSSNL